MADKETIQLAIKKLNELSLVVRDLQDLLNIAGGDHLYENTGIGITIDFNNSHFSQFVTKYRELKDALILKVGELP